MAGRVRRCRHCWQPLRATARRDALYCDRACKAAARRLRRHRAETTYIAIAFINGEETEHVVRCPVCGTCFALGHGHRRDAVYDRPACRQEAYRARRRGAERVREAVTAPAGVTAPVPPSTALASADA
ncbi:hypothetical protein [Streptomyces lonegramiae]|uniref:Recombination endonuclease VII n=1 Tax=Streptomyces lonegramiae TaxID=3075524 RepID=A0ABU2XG86_9ACTN|nr:hypothetical protein [Streptomyces sp. DSM 41529]MDT0544906.1 hypothetical protein [Streptomyces sp. DSM 41529]